MSGDELSRVEIGGDIWDSFREKGRNAYMIEFPGWSIEM